MSDFQLKFNAVWDKLLARIDEEAKEEQLAASGQEQDASNLDAIDRELLGEFEPDEGSDNRDLAVPPIDSDRLLKLISMRGDGEESELLDSRSIATDDAFADLSQVYVESNETEDAPEPEITAEQAARISARPRRALKRRRATARGTLSGRSFPVSQPPAAPQQPFFPLIESSQSSIPESTAELPTDKGKGKKTEEDVLRREIREELEKDLKAAFDLQLLSERTGWDKEKARWESEKGRTKAQTDQAANSANAVVESLKDKIRMMEQDISASFSKGQQAAISNHSSQLSTTQEQLQTTQTLLDEEMKRVAGHTLKIARQEKEISRLRREGRSLVGDLKQQLAAKERILERARREVPPFQESWTQELAAKDEDIKLLKDQLGAEKRSHDEAMRQFREQRSQPGTSTEPANAPDPQPQQSLAHPDQQRLEAQVASMQAELAKTTADAVEQKRLAQEKLEDASLSAKRKIRTLEGEAKVTTESWNRLLEARNSLEADLNQRNDDNRALSQEVSALQAKLRGARRKVRKVEGQVVELTEATEASEAEMRSVVAANRALEAEKKKGPAPSLWESYPLVEGQSLRMKSDQQMGKLEEMGHRLKEYEAKEKEANRRLAEYEAREKEAEEARKVGELEDWADGREEVVASSSSESAAVAEEADAPPSLESTAVAEEVKTGEKEMDALLGVPMGAIEGLLRPLFPRWKEFLYWLLVILLLIGIVAAFSEASAAEMAREMWLTKGFSDLPGHPHVLEDPWWEWDLW